MSRLCRHAYEILLIQLGTGKQNRAFFVKQLLTTHGFGIVWMCQGVGFEQGFLWIFQDRMIASYKQDWRACIEESEKYYWYSSFKSVFQTEKSMF